jgi:integrase
MFTELINRGRGTWIGVRSPGLAALANDVPGVLADSHAPATNKLYAQAFARWKSWTNMYPEVCHLPTTAEHLILYLVFLGRSAASYSVLNVAVSAIAWGHKLAGLASPADSPLVLEVLSGLKRRIGYNINKKEPFLLKDLHLLMDGADRKSITCMRNISLMLLAFFGFMRCSEVTAIKCQHLGFFPDRLEIFISKSKTDQLREGSTLPIARLPGQHCPVAFIEQYMCLTGERVSSSNFLFRRVVSLGSGRGFALHASNKAINYNTVRDLIKEYAVKLGHKASSFGTHSLRSGGSSSAANGGVSDRMFQRHGRWASSGARDGYIKDCMVSRLAVTKNMV